MNSHQELAENGKVWHHRLAEAALERYALVGARLTLISDSECAIYKVSVPAGEDQYCHPYLGRLNGHQLLLRIEDSADKRIASTYSELVLLAAMLRDTDLLLPEPVPSADGELVPELWLDGMVEPQQCVLFRWAGIPFPDHSLSLASHWQTN